MIRRPPRSTLSSSSAASDVYKRQPPLFPMHFFLLWSSSARAGANCNHGPSARDAVIECVKVADRIPLPCAEIYDVVVAPAAVVGGLRRGFGANAQRVAARAADRPVASVANVEPCRKRSPPRVASRLGPRPDHQ